MRNSKRMRHNGQLTIFDSTSDDVVFVKEVKRKTRVRKDKAPWVAPKPDSYELLVRVNSAVEFDTEHPPHEFSYRAWVSTKSSRLGSCNEAVKKDLDDAGVATRWDDEDVLHFEVRGDAAEKAMEKVYVEVVRVGRAEDADAGGCSEPERVVGRAKFRVYPSQKQFDFEVRMIGCDRKYDGFIRLSTFMMRSILS